MKDKNIYSLTMTQLFSNPLKKHFKYIVLVQHTHTFGPTIEMDWNETIYNGSSDCDTWAKIPNANQIIWKSWHYNNVVVAFSFFHSSDKSQFFETIQIENSQGKLAQFARMEANLIYLVYKYMLCTIVYPSRNMFEFKKTRKSKKNSADLTKANRLECNFIIIIDMMYLVLIKVC